MRKLILLNLVLFLIGCNAKPQGMGPDFAMFDGYYFFSTQLKRLGTEHIPNKDSIWFGKLNVENSTLELIDGDSWNVIKVIELVPYKGNIFLAKKYDDIFIKLRPAHSKEPTGQHGLSFVKDKDNSELPIAGGYFVHELKSIEDCKKFLADWKADLEKTNCKKESCYGN